MNKFNKFNKFKTILIDMYGVIIEESKGNFIPYTYSHFDESEYERLTKQFREEKLFTSVSNLQAAAKLGIMPVLFNRDGAEYNGTAVNTFQELGKIVEEI